MAPRRGSTSPDDVVDVASKIERPPAPLIVVSNRLPFVLKRHEDGVLRRSHSAGGLVTALGPVVIQCGGLWIGWPGSNDLTSADSIPESDPSDQTSTAGLKPQQVKLVLIDTDLFESFYNGCCNGTFWPLFHSMPDRAVFSSDTWKAYESVNEEFALKTLDALRQVDRRLKKDADASVPIIWIHDYHLMLAATMIRKVATEEHIPCKLGFFLHIPFPSWDIMRLFPWEHRVLEGILACDLVAFHILDYCNNFIGCCQRRLGCRVDWQHHNIEFGGRVVHVRPLPIGIPYQRFERLAATAPRVMQGQERVILGVDRLDYTKGLVQRMRAFERLLEHHPEHLGNVILMQIAVPSRIEVKEYRALKEEMDQLVGRINGRFSRPNWSPIRYMYGCVSQEELVAFYRDSAVALVTPLRDGMNLVAKEYVASQINEAGVLILSPFAGAGDTMTEALLVNPYDVDRVAETIDTALKMDEDERRLRMKQLRRRECDNDVDHWMANFLAEMDCIECTITGVLPQYDRLQHPVKDLRSQDYDQYLPGYIDESSKLVILLDYDGTLAPIAPHPDKAVLSEGMRNVLRQLSQMPSVSVCVMSGRSLDNLKRMVDIDGITYAASEGLEILHPDGSRFTHPVPDDYHSKLLAVVLALQEVCVEGAWMENKGSLLTYHCRTTPYHRHQALLSRAVAIFKEHGFYPYQIQMGVEVRPWDKGRAAVYILRTIYGADWQQRVRIIYAGDERSDEDVMEILTPLHACCFRIAAEVAHGTAANFRLDNSAALLSVLRWIHSRMARTSILPHIWSKCDDVRAVRNHLAAEISTKFLVTCVHSELDCEKDTRDAETDTLSERKRRRYFDPTPSSSVIKS